MTTIAHIVCLINFIYKVDKCIYVIEEVKSCADPLTPYLEKNVDFSLFQASGEAQYTGDIPEIPGELYGAFVTATKVG